MEAAVNHWRKEAKAMGLWKKGKGGILAVLSLIFAVTIPPVRAGWDKAYRWRNKSGIVQHTCRVLLNGIEVIANEDTSNDNPWGASVKSYQVISGVYCTVLNYGSGNAVTVSPNQWVRIGFNTADHTVRLRDLRWGSGAAITPDENLSGVPGGGWFLYDPGKHVYLWTISNDTGDQTIQLSNVEFFIFCPPTPGASATLSFDELGQVTEAGIVSVLLSRLRAEVINHWKTRNLPGFPYASLVAKLDSAAQYNAQAFKAWEDGDLQAALWFWGWAIQYMQDFIAELTPMKNKGTVRKALAERWIAMAEQIIDRLEPPGTDPVPGVPTQLAPSGLPDVPGESFTLSVAEKTVGPGCALVLYGCMPDDEGVVWGHWAEQVEIRGDLESPVLYAGLFVNGQLYTGQYRFTDPVTVNIYSPSLDLDYLLIADHLPMKNGLVPWMVYEPLPAWQLDPSEPVWSQTFVSGQHVIAFIGVDSSGNASEIQTVYFEIEPD